ncbi:LegC family aminotransferase [Halanaerobiaceae bacterium Z-7014]|uniref:LegC family aminotransferase n=2 Tax=Halonatronomonas betaini TaxID=2778430 RepID=A0A931AU56_9FIRM|nr:LegC family aminotransferase [Halonatronomonas betaini]
MVFIKIYSKDFFYKYIIEDKEQDELAEIISNKMYSYLRFEYEKKNGYRFIYSMKKDTGLYEVQTKLKDNFLNEIPIADHVYGFVSGYSYKDFLVRHCYEDKNKTTYFLRLDIQDFFESIKTKMIKETLEYYIKIKDEDNPTVLDLINDLVTINDFLPQGAITSPVLSNIVFRQLDIRFQKYCRKINIKYSRYADDLLFSSKESYLHKRNFTNKIRHILKDKGFKLNFTKTIKSQNEISLNGFVVGNNIRLSRKRNHDISMILYLYDNQSVDEFINILNKENFIYRNKKYDMKTNDEKYFINQDDLINYLAGYRSFLIDWIPIKDGKHKEKHIKLIKNLEVLLEDLSDINNEYNYKGDKMSQKENIPLSVPNLSKDILPNIEETIESGWVSTGGKFIDQFEEKLADYVGVDQAVSCQSGTAGLHLAMRVLGIGPGDEVIAPTVTFIAAVNPIRYMGAEPVFIDCDSDDGPAGPSAEPTNAFTNEGSVNMDLDKLEEFLENECELTDGRVINKSSGREIKAINIVHVFGNPVNMERLIDIAREYGLKVIEDATEALGSYYTEGRYAGRYCGTIGDIGVYSFNANKIITTGGGGMIVARESDLLEEAKFLSTQAKSDRLYYRHDEVGYNYRMTNIQAAFGTDQIDRLEGFIATKIENYRRYKEAIAEIDGLELMAFNEGCRPNHWFYSVLVDPDLYGIDRDELLQELNAVGIQTRPLWGLIHQQKPYLDCQAYRIEQAPYYQQNLINLPCSSNLTAEQVKTVVRYLREFKS